MIARLRYNLMLAVRQHWPILLIGALVTLVNELFNGQYGFHRDELDILINARHLDWGYVAYPPFTPFIARVGLTLFGSSLQGLRLFPALGQGVTVILVGIMASDLGGKREAQVMAALATAIAPVALVAGTIIQYMAFDYLWWVLIAFCYVRLLKTENPRWWLGIGAALGMAMMTKYTPVFFIIGLISATLLTPNRRYLRSPWLWAGAALAGLIFLPNLIWQIRHNFISLDFLSSIHARDIAWGRTNDFVPQQFLIATHPASIPLWIMGLGLSLFSADFKRFRALGMIFLVTFGSLLIARGIVYYLAPAYPMLFAVGATGWEAWLAKSPHTRQAWKITGWTVLIIGAITGVILVKPIAPINSALWKITSGINREVVEMIGWEDLAAEVGAIYADIPAEEKPHSVILAGNYGEAGALELFGPAYGLPPVISGANSFWERGYGNYEPETVILVGYEPTYAYTLFRACKSAGRVTNRYGVKNEESTDHIGLYVCRQPRRPWAELWPGLRRFQ